MWGKRESQTANGKNFSLALEMTTRESDVFQSLGLLVSQSPSLLVTSHQSLATNHQKTEARNERLHLLVSRFCDFQRIGITLRILNLST